MSVLARVTCPDCLGASNGNPSHPWCGRCHGQGHFDIDREPDGSFPALHPDAKPVVEWVDRLLPDFPTP